MSDHNGNEVSRRPRKDSGQTPAPDMTMLEDEDEAHVTSTHIKANPKEDMGNIAVLILLYILQAVPLGLAQSIPMLLANQHVKYHEQAIFSFAFWPFSMKLLWAPIVDSLFLSKLGRRKSWVIPSQLLIGITMIYISDVVPAMLKPANGSIDVYAITAVFTSLNFLAATQDIGVDGWALTMLKEENVAWASTCNSVGQTAGFFIGYVGFLAFESAEFCNGWLRSTPQPEGIVTIQSFLFNFGIIFIIISLLVWVFKHEKPETHVVENVTETYKLLWKILTGTAVKYYIPFILTAKIGFAAVDGITSIKIVDSGLPQDKLALLSVPMTPIQILLPFVIAKYTAGPSPLLVFMNTVPARLLVSLTLPACVHLTAVLAPIYGHDFPLWYYVVIIVSYILQQVCLYTMFVSVMSFHAKVSDPLIGGTYMTLLNTVTNLGGNWPVTLSLWLVDDLTWKSCHVAGVSTTSCSSDGDAKSCMLAGGECNTDIDGYYILVAVTTVFGFIWYFLMRAFVCRLQGLSMSKWRLPRTSAK